MALALVVAGVASQLAAIPLPAPLDELEPHDALADSSYTPSNAIVDITAVALDDEPDSNPCPSGYKWIDTDLNRWAGGDWVYFCYKEGTLDDAITDIKAIFNSTSCGDGWTRVATDLNAGTGDAPIYLCHRKDQGLPIIQLDVVTGITELVPCSWVDGDWTRVQQDLNDDASGLFIYLCYMDLAGVNGIDGCGNEGEAPCGPFTKFVWENGSGNCDRGLQQWGGECVNGLGDHARYHDEVTQFQDSWTHWAMQNQRQQLAWNEPLSSVMMLGAHNAYNNRADGYLLPNHTYSITDQLRAGARYIELDVHGGKPHLNGTQPQLCHSDKQTHAGCVIGDRQFYNAVKEIRNWLIKPENLDEVIIIALYDLFYESDAETADQDSIDQTLAAIDVYFNRDSRIGIFSANDFSANGNAFPSQAELAARGKRVILWSEDANLNPLVLTYDQWPNALNRLPAEIEQGFWDEQTCSASDEGEFDPNFSKFRTVYENNVPVVGGAIDQFFPPQVARLAECNVTILDFDGILAPPDFPGDVPGARLRAMVWSWAESERGEPGNAAYFSDSDRRWHSAVPETEFHYVCLEDEDTGSTAVTSPVFGEIFWRVTDATGPFDGGAAACEAEFSGSTFNVPRNGYENMLLGIALDHADTDGPAWLNYHDLNGDGWWASRPVGALVGPEKTAEGKAAYFDFGFTEPVHITAVSCGEGSHNIHATDDNDYLIGQTLTEGTIGCFFPSGPGSSIVSMTGTSGQEDVTLEFAVTIENVAPSLVPANIFAWTGNPVEKEVEEEALFPAQNPHDPDIVPLIGTVRDPGWDDQPMTGMIDWGDGTTQDLTDLGGLFALPFGEGPGGCDRRCGVVDSIHGQHSWSTPGVYDVDVEVCDTEGACTRATLYRVTVSGLVPEVILPANATLDEGDRFNDTAVISIPDNADTYEVAVNYGDGSGFTTMPVTSADTSLILDHTYLDNGIYRSEVVICDDEGDCASDTFVVNVANLPPQIDPISNLTIDEGEEFRTTVTFSDPGTGDTHGWGVNFGDGTTTLPISDLTQTGTSFDIAHTYAEDGVYTVSVAVADDDITSANPIETSFTTESFTVTVLNVAPEITDIPAELTVDEGEFFAKTVLVNEPGVEDTLTYEIDYGDGTPIVGPAPLGDGILGLELQHTYLDDGEFTLSVTFCDDDDGCTTGNIVVTVFNVAPLVTVGGNATIDQGAPFSRIGSFADPGVDTWTATVNYGDGGGSQPLALNGTSFTLSHVYTDGDNDPYTVEVCVTDDDGDEGCASFQMAVLSAADQVVLLSETIEGMGLPHGIAKSLLNMLDEIRVSLEAGALTDACNQLNAFRNHVMAQAGNQLSSEQVAEIIGDVNRIRSTLGCG